MKSPELHLPKSFVFSELKSKLFFTVNLLALAGAPAMAADLSVTNGVSVKTISTNDLTDKSLEELWNTPVTIIGPSEKVSKTPAAVSVVTQDDIRRSGAVNVPEALRMVPGLDVAQID